MSDILGVAREQVLEQGVGLSQEQLVEVLRSPDELLPELLALAHIDFGPLYERVQGQPEYEPGRMLDGDTLMTRGTGRYHADKRREQCMSSSVPRTATNAKSGSSRSQIAQCRAAWECGIHRVRRPR